MKKQSPLHPGFQKVAAMIAKKSGVPMKNAGAILASKTRNSSEEAKKKNPKLNRVLGIVLLILAIPSLALAQKTTSLNTANSQESILITFACEGTNCAGLTIDATAGGIALTSAKYNPTVTGLPSGFSQAQIAICTNSGAKIWVTVNSAITLASGDGQPINDGTTFTIYGYTNVANFKAIRDASTSSTLRCDYYRQP